MLDQLSPGNDIGFLAGCSVSAHNVQAVMDAVRDDDGKPKLGAADFGHTTFLEPVAFNEAVFSDVAYFNQATCKSDIYFVNCLFGDDLHCLGIKADGDAIITDCTFEGDVNFSEAAISGYLTLTGVTLAGGIQLCDGTFGSRVDLTGTAVSVNASGARVKDGGRIRLGGATMNFRALSTGSPLTIAQPPATSHSASEPWARVVSLEDADLTDVTIADADLSQCRFRGANHLDQLRIEQRARFRSTPSSWRPPGRSRVVPRLTKRLVLAEEVEWRRAYDKDDRWHQLSDQARAPAPDTVITPVEVASLYRSLRKGREDQKDAAGAGDFYYGEMEMRRKSDPRVATRPSGEGAVLTFYWLFAGYGLRPGRALLALLCTIALATTVLTFHGLKGASSNPAAVSAVTPPASGVTTTTVAPSTSTPSQWDRFGRALEVSLDTALFRTNPANLNRLGEYVGLLVRFLGPVFIALAVLGVRGRIVR